MKNETSLNEPVQSPRGIKLLIEAVRAEPSDEFPMDRSAIDYNFGDIELEDGKGGFIPVRDLSDHLKGEEFETGDEVLQALQDAMVSWKGLDLHLTHLDENDSSNDLPDDNSNDFKEAV